MHFSLVAAAATLLSAASVQAADHLIKVGANAQLVFDPSSITAVAGDTVSFQFQGKNHSVTQSTFPAPCTKMANGIDSGFMSVPSGSTQLPQWTLNITDATTPLWFFCAQLNPVDHCSMGMVFAVNAPPTKTFDQFQTAAKATGSNATTTNSTTTSGTTTSGSTAATTTTTTKSGALKLGGSAAAAMTVAALFLGVAL
ncbi:hypothetical protein BDN70DRAFT_797210 [Pholiota conissans]|uniref:Cupredoxin n=1 Tax=Pholiota conissans TaxID=109636 RepID=A0A9P5ZDW4_9AGAR|nr:hypothetical protein BDN70DRAFT_797210 [Pholiota conissans]